MYGMLNYCDYCEVLLNLPVKKTRRRVYSYASSSVRLYLDTVCSLAHNDNA